MAVTYRMSPGIGVARLGNSPEAFYVGPQTTGGRPTEYDSNTRTVTDTPVARYKDGDGRIKRQAALFRLFAIDDATGETTEITLANCATYGIAGITWQAHLANKKACWYNFAELEGNLLLGPDNSYEKRGVPLRNAGVTGREERQKLIIDPGPRTVTGANQRADFSRDTVPADYPHASFPPKPSSGQQIDTLGEMLTDSEGRLLILGGYGRSGGNEPITSFAGADTWHDDISDGPVTCTLIFTDTSTRVLTAWCIVGSPKYVPEVVNIVTLDDVMFEVAVRDLGLLPGLWHGGGYNPDFIANYERDIKPILERPAGYRWVAAVPVLNSFSPPPFDPTDASEAARPLRRAYFSLFRTPGENGFTGGETTVLFDGDTGIPKMPLNSGSNSVSNELLDKFLTLTRTQYFLLGQWAEGKFTTEPPAPLPGVGEPDRAVVANCVGGPLCPGIEVTWSLYSPAQYEAPYRIRHRHDAAYYAANGLDPHENETDPNAPDHGCEPGDLTKRMAIPWQSDFFQCTIQYVNFTDPEINKVNGVPKPPTYYAYWWPPQSPWNVMTGDLTPAEQELAGVPAGLQVNFARGVNSFAEMIRGWSYLGFIVNTAAGPYRDLFPYFVEQERNHDRFAAASVAVAGAQNVVTGEDTNFFNTWYMRPQRVVPAAARGEEAEEIEATENLVAVRPMAGRGRSSWRRT